MQLEWRIASPEFSFGSGIPQSASLAAPMPMVVLLEIEQGVPTEAPASQYSPTEHGKQLRMFAE